jgi:hypothetical protein
VAARAAPETAPPARKLVLLALALLLVLAAVVFVLRRERGAEPAKVVDAASMTTLVTPPSKAAPGLRCPKCGARFAAGNAFCGTDGERLVPDAADTLDAL